VTQPIVVDANPLISALLGGVAVQVLTSDLFVFYSTQHTMFEVEKYIPRLAQKIGCTELQLYATFQLLPVTAFQPAIYEKSVPQATRLIGSRDVKDIPVLALALSLGYPLWSSDRDFEGISEIQLVKTSELMGRIEQGH